VTTELTFEVFYIF